MKFALYLSIKNGSFVNKISFKASSMRLEYVVKFQVNPLSIHDLTVLSSKGPPARKPPFFNEVTETAAFRDGEEHAFVAAKQSRLYKTFNAAHTESRGGPYEEAGR